MTRSARREEHLNPDHGQTRRHSNQARHGGVALVPERRQAGIGQGDEGGGEEMHEGGGDQDAGAEVAREEEEAVRDGQLGEAAGDDGERARCDGALAVHERAGRRCGPLPSVLSTRMRTRAKTWRGVL